MRSPVSPFVRNLALIIWFRPRFRITPTLIECARHHIRESHTIFSFCFVVLFYEPSGSVNYYCLFFYVHCVGYYPTCKILPFLVIP